MHRFSLFSVVLLWSACARTPPVRLTPCTIDEVVDRTLCGTLDVFEDRVHNSGRRITLKIVKLPATGGSAKPDPLFFLADGPGDAVTGQAAAIASSYRDLLQTRDIVLVDQRGSGGSHDLPCDLYPGRGAARYFGAFQPPEAVALCRHRVTRDANLWFYTTTEAADDFADVLHALGYRSANLIGSSYGTRVAMVMVRRHPAIVRSLVLLGVSPVDHRIPLTFAADAQAALDRLLSECERTPDCAAAFPRIRAEAASVIERFAREPVRAQLRDPDGDGVADVAVSKNLLGEVLQWMLSTPPEARRIPALLHRVASGDARVVAERALGIRRTVMDASGMGLYLSVMCAEDLPRIDPAAAAASAQGTFLGDYRYREQKAACVEWPQVAVGADFYAPIDSRVPTLILSGELDPVTPPRLGDSIGSHFTNGMHIYVPYGGRGFDGLTPVSCLSQIRRDFIERGTADGIDTGCLGQLRPPPFEIP